MNCKLFTEILNYSEMKVVPLEKKSGYFSEHLPCTIWTEQWIVTVNSEL